MIYDHPFDMMAQFFEIGTVVPISVQNLNKTFPHSDMIYDFISE